MGTKNEVGQNCLLKFEGIIYVMRNYFYPLIIIGTFIWTSCKDQTQPAEETPQEVQVNEQQPEETSHQSNVVTPEFWDNFDTDVRVVFFYSKKESSPEYIHKIKEEIKAASGNLGYTFHEYHTDENMGMVQVDDDVFFNLTEYLWNSDEGFVLLRKGALLHIPASQLSEEGIGSAVADFFI